LSPDTISIWLTKEDNPEAEQITFTSTSEDAFVLIQRPEEYDGFFVFQGIFPDGQTVPIGPPDKGFYFDPDGDPVPAGNVNPEHEESSFLFVRIEVISGGMMVTWIDITTET
jgi:hypothetical protein